MARCEGMTILGREVSSDASLPLVTGQYKGTRNLDWSDEDSAGHLVPLAGAGQHNRPEGRSPASVTRFKAVEEVSIAVWLETEQNKFGNCREPYIAQPSSQKQ